MFENSPERKSLLRSFMRDHRVLDVKRGAIGGAKPQILGHSRKLC
jgi:hypothetical protein